MNNYIVLFEDGTHTPTFESKRDLAAVVAYVRADGQHDVWSKHTSRAAARKFINSARAESILDPITTPRPRENASRLHKNPPRPTKFYSTNPARPMRFYVADTIAQD